MQHKSLNGLTLALATALLALYSTVLLAVPDVQVLAVGTNHSFKPSLETLKFAEEDARRFAEAMKTVGLVPDIKATVVTNASVADFREAFRAAKELAARDDSLSRKFIFYFSGHSDDKGLHMRDGMISKSELHDMLTKVSAHTKIAILDSCFSGGITAKGIETAPAFELPKVEFDEPSGSVFLTASTGKQLAYESDDLEGSIFTHHLLAGLYGEADGNGDGVVTVDELYQHVYRNTKWQSINYPSSSTQEPEYIARLQGQGAIVLSFPSKTNSQLTLGKEISGDITIASPKGIQFFKVEKLNGQEKTIQLPIGAYQVSVRDGTRVGEGNIKVEPARVAFLAQRDMTWRAGSVQTASLAKGAEPSTAATVQASDPEVPSRFGFMLGAHTGYSNSKAYGPFFEFNYRLPVLHSKSAEFYVGGAFDGHRSRSETSLTSDSAASISATSQMSKAAFSMDVTTDTVAAFAVLGFSLTPSQRLPLSVGGEFGYGQAYNDQKFHREGMTTDRTGGYAPISMYGTRFEWAFASGRRVGLALRREVMNVEKVIVGAPPVRADAIALTTTF